MNNISNLSPLDRETFLKSIALTEDLHRLQEKGQISIEERDTHLQRLAKERYNWVERLGKKLC